MCVCVQFKKLQLVLVFSFIAGQFFYSSEVLGVCIYTSVYLYDWFFPFVSIRIVIFSLGAGYLNVLFVLIYFSTLLKQT